MRAARLIVLAAVAVAAGFLLVTQVRAERLIRRNLGIRSYQLDDLAFRLRTEERRLEDLRQEAATLRARLADLTERAAAADAAVSARARELRGLRMVTGLEPMYGPGVVVELADSSRPLRPGESASEVLVHYSDLRAVVGELWNSGAEAIAINGERLIGTSGIECVGTTLLVNDRRLAPPFRITAIGDTDTMALELARPGGVVGLLRAFGFPVSVASHADVDVPGYDGAFRHAPNGAARVGPAQRP